MTGPFKNALKIAIYKKIWMIRIYSYLANKVLYRSNATPILHDIFRVARLSSVKCIGLMCRLNQQNKPESFVWLRIYHSKTLLKKECFKVLTFLAEYFAWWTRIFKIRRAYAFTIFDFAFCFPKMGIQEHIALLSQLGTLLLIAAKNFNLFESVVDFTIYLNNKHSEG